MTIGIPIRIRRSMRLPVRAAIDCSGVTSRSSLMPSGVSSKIHEQTSAGTKPIASRILSVLGTQSGTSNNGSRASAPCTINHAAIRYRPAIRITLRLFSSSMKLIAVHRCSRVLAGHHCPLAGSRAGNPPVPRSRRYPGQPSARRSAGLHVPIEAKEARWCWS